MGIEQSVIDGIKSTLPLCNSVDLAYHYDWTNCSIRDIEDDPNSVPESEYPFIGINFPEEISESQERNSARRQCLLKCQLRVIPLKAEAERTTREDIDNILVDIKRYIGQNHTLNGACFACWYDRSFRVSNQISGKHHEVIVNLNIRYFETIVDP